MRERLQTFTRVRVPDFAVQEKIGLGIGHREDVRRSERANVGQQGARTYAVKSALPDAAREVSGESLLLQTAPLWPMKVPIQSPVHSRSIGLPSLQLEINTYVPSS